MEGASFKARQLGGYGCCKQELGVEKTTDCSLGLRSNIRDMCNQSESHTAMSERGSLFLKLMSTFLGLEHSINSHSKCLMCHSYLNFNPFK